MRTVLVFALVFGLAGGWSNAAESRPVTIVGAWVVDVTPQSILPEFPVAPPPFLSFFHFDFAKTVTETDTALHANSNVPVFPPDVLPPLNSSDGYGTWRRVGRDRFICTFTKLLFDPDGVHLGFVRTSLELDVYRDGTLEGEGKSEFVLGADLDGDVFFTGPVSVDGSRLRALHH